MYQISSSKTLIVKIFLPVFWITFFTAFALAVNLGNKEAANESGLVPLKIGSVAFLLIGVFVFYKTIFPLKRIDLDQDHIYVSNYLKNVRYKREDLQNIQIDKGLLFNFGTANLSGEGSFGKEIRFLVSVKKLNLALNNLPLWKSTIQVEE